MKQALETLEKEFSENNARLSSIGRELAALTQESEKLKKNNEHLAYSISLIRKQSGNIEMEPRLGVYGPTQSINDAVERITLRATLLNIMSDGNPINISKAWELVTTRGIKTTRATVNATLHNLVKKGVLVQPETGLYKKVI